MVKSIEKLLSGNFFKLQFSSLNKYIEKLRDSTVILYGAGAKGRQALTLLRYYGIEPVAVCDSNEKKWGLDFDGLKVTSYASIRSCFRDNVIVLLTVSSCFVKELNNKISYIDRKYPGRVLVKQLCIPFKTEVSLLSDEDIISSREQIEASYSFLSDDMSRLIFKKTIEYKITGDFSPLLDYLERVEPSLGFFDTDFLPYNYNHVYVDVGAFTGDSLISFAMAVRGSYKQMIAFEGDRGIYDSLCKMLAYSRLPNIRPVNKLLYRDFEEKKWYSVFDNGDVLFDSPNLYKNAEVIFPQTDMSDRKKIKFSSEIVHTDTLDNSLNCAPTVIKINAMGADYDILQGGIDSIRTSKPMLCMEFGVRKRDVGELILLIRKINPNSTFAVQY